MDTLSSTLKAGLQTRRLGAVDGDTLFPVFSTSKGIVAAGIHLLSERGQLGYDVSISEYYPEFATHGKARQLLV